MFPPPPTQMVDNVPTAEESDVHVVGGGDDPWPWCQVPWHCRTDCPESLVEGVGAESEADPGVVWNLEDS